MSLIRSSHKYLVLDTCCMLNMIATQFLEDILSQLPTPVLIPDVVAHEEVISLNNLEGELVNWDDLEASGLIEIVSMQHEQEYDYFTDLSGNNFGKGEACVGALALHNHWAIGIDDRRFINLFAREYQSIQIINTPEIIHHWAVHNAPPPSQLKDALQRIEQDASYIPPKTHAFYDWWQQNNR